MRKTVLRHRLVAFFILAYSISWILWLPAILAYVQRRASFEEVALFRFAGSFGPFAAALVMTALEEGSAGVSTILKRLVQWRVGVVSWLMALYGFLILALVALFIVGVADAHDFSSLLPAALVVFPINTLTTFLVLGPLGEEPGWRGYALPHLLQNRSALASSAILGILWAYWHFPLMVFPDRRSDLAFIPFLIVYPLYIIPLTVIITWMFNRSSGSVLIAMVLHSSFNYTAFTLSDRLDWGGHDPLAVLGGMAGVFWLTVLALLILDGPRLGLRPVAKAGDSPAG